MDAPFIIYNTCQTEEVVPTTSQESSVNYEYQILNNVPVCSNISTTLNSPHNNSQNNENVNSCGEAWMTPNAIDDLKKILNEWQFGSLFPAFFGNLIYTFTPKILVYFNICMYV